MARKPIYKRIWPYVVVGVLAIGALGGNSSDKKPEEEKPATRVVLTPAPEKEDWVRVEITPAPDEEIFVAPLREVDPETETPAPLQTLAPVEAAAPVPDRSIPDPTPAPAPAPTSTPAPIAAVPDPTQTPISAECYVAPTGKRYHYSKDCAGPNAIPITQDDAVARGYTPCKKCAGG